MVLRVRWMFASLEDRKDRVGNQQNSPICRAPVHFLPGRLLRARFDLAACRVVLLALFLCSSCARPETPEVTFARTQELFVHGDLVRSQQEAERGYQLYKSSNPDWAARFANVEAESLLWGGLYDRVLTVLDGRPVPRERSSRIQMLALRGAALARLGRFSDSNQNLREAENLCRDRPDTPCGGVSRAFGVLAMEQGNHIEGERRFLESLNFARSHGDQLLEATALLNVGVAALRERRFDEAADRTEEAYRVAERLGARDLAQNAVGNLGWAYYRLGNTERALENFSSAASIAAQLGDISDQASWLTGVGYAYFDQGKLALAAGPFNRALDLEHAVNSKEDISVILRVLARLSLRSGDLTKAEQYAAQVLEISRETGVSSDRLYAVLVQGQIAAQRGNFAEAVSMIREVEQDKRCPISLRWEAQHYLARLAEDQHHLEEADREYRIALVTFESDRQTINREDLKLSFLTNGLSIYDDYIRFLVAQGRSDEALRWADFSRARTLSRGLGLLPKVAATSPPPLDASQVAARAQGVILFYWLGEAQSYLWVVTATKESEFTLPPGAAIEAAVDRYRKALAGPQDVLQSADRDGRWLYATLVAPAERLLPKNANVLIIPDGRLNNLNFETLLVERPQLHFWIEDVTIANASSLRLLDGRASARQVTPNLFLIGNSVAPNDKYPELSRAGAQVERVAQHFPVGQLKVLTREQATPDAYFNGNPERYSYIHFVAHGTASRSSPLDSAIVLSKPSAGSDAFKLYARDVIRHPLQAELVTISACYSTGERAYSGEGLVGLSWAFLRAGARNVIAALWEATDVSTVQLMDNFYKELNRGASPDAALRRAKLSLLHGSGYRNPFYWAPFQLYGRGSTRRLALTLHARFRQH